MTRLRLATIPSEFIRLDDTFTDPDEVVSVFTQQRARENFNMLVARRVRQPLLTVRFKDADYTVDGHSLRGYIPIREYASGLMAMADNSMLGPWKIAIPPYCQYVTAWLWAKAVTDLDTLVYYTIRGPTGFYQLRDQDKVTVTGASYAEYETNIPVPPEAREAGYAEIAAFYVSEMDTTSDGAAGNVISYGDSYIIGDTQIAEFNGNAFNILYFPTDSTIEPRTVISQDEVEIDAATTYYKIVVDQPFNKFPDIEDTYNGRSLGEFIPQSLCLTPKAISDFADNDVMR